MGSLYDIGNFRYKHFTFYTCEGSTCKSNTNVDEQLKNFLNSVWPFRGLMIGDSSEGDYAFVTYAQQKTNTETNEIITEIENIYIYTRISLGASEPEWTQAVEPVKTLQPDSNKISE